MTASDRLTNSLHDVLELEQFLHSFISTLTGVVSAAAKM
jgi:hypothetical protein